MCTTLFFIISFYFPQRRTAIGVGFKEIRNKISEICKILALRPFFRAYRFGTNPMVEPTQFYEGLYEYNLIEIVFFHIFASGKVKQAGGQYTVDRTCCIR